MSALEAELSAAIERVNGRHPDPLAEWQATARTEVRKNWAAIEPLLQELRELTPGGASRFPRAEITLEATGLAAAFRAAAVELDELAGAAPAYDPSTLRRKLRGIVLATTTLVAGSEVQS